MLILMRTVQLEFFEQEKGSCCTLDALSAKRCSEQKWKTQTVQLGSFVEFGEIPWDSLHAEPSNKVTQYAQLYGLAENTFMLDMSYWLSQHRNCLVALDWDKLLYKCYFRCSSKVRFNISINHLHVVPETRLCLITSISLEQSLLNGWWHRWSWTRLPSSSLGFRRHWCLQSTGWLGSLPPEWWHFPLAGGSGKWHNATLPEFGQFALEVDGLPGNWTWIRGCECWAFRAFESWGSQRCQSSPIFHGGGQKSRGRPVHFSRFSGARGDGGRCDPRILNRLLASKRLCRRGHLQSTICPHGWRWNAGISVSWAGGRRGREVIDVLMPKVARILSNRGLFYLVCITENDPEELLENGRALGFLAEKVKQEQRGMEELFILRFQKATESSWKELNKRPDLHWDLCYFFGIVLVLPFLTQLVHSSCLSNLIRCICIWTEGFEHHQSC